MLLITMKGPPGSGKSTLARALSRQLGWPLIDKDDIKDIIDGHASDPGRLAYDAMFNVARRQLRLGLSVICDSPLTFNGLYQQAQQIANETGATLAVIECHCSNEQIWRERINSRQDLNLPAHHQTDWDAMQTYLSQVAGKANYPIAEPYLVLDTVAPLDELVKKAVAWLGSV
ncbi:MAG: ATP-binding protein [Candidatus Chloroheliales bacterium]|nr:MAG: ATP-binding protein [Chloroflexota bacterium]